MLISELMIPNPPVLTPHMTMPDALRFMKEKNVHRMPVVDPDGTLVGIISETDLHNASPSGDIVGMGILEISDAKGARGEITLKVQDLSKEKLMTILKPFVTEFLDVRET